MRAAFVSSVSLGERLGGQVRCPPAAHLGGALSSEQQRVCTVGSVTGQTVLGPGALSPRRAVTQAPVSVRRARAERAHAFLEPEDLQVAREPGFGRRSRLREPLTGQPACP